MIKNIFKGIQAYSGAFAMISRLKLWNYFLIPIAISVVTASVIFLTAYGLSDNISEFITRLLPNWADNSWVKGIFSFVSGIVIIIIGLILYKHIIMALSAPFMSPVSEKIESYLTGIERNNHRNTSFSEQLWRGIKINMRNLLKELLISIPLLLLKFIPVVNIISTALLFLIQAHYAGFGNMDYTLERHLNYRKSIQFIRKHKGIAIGNGIVFILFLFIPFIGVILVLPLSVTAATIKTVQLLKQEDLFLDHKMLVP